LEHPAVDALMAKIRRVGVPLVDFAGVKPYRGILTGCNEAFLISQETRDRIVREDPSSIAIIKPLIRGRDIKRWSPKKSNDYIILSLRGIEIEKFPSVLKHLEGFRDQLEPKPPDWSLRLSSKWKGRKSGKYQWYEIQDTVDYQNLFEESKIIYPDITWSPQFSFVKDTMYFVNTGYLIPSVDRYLCSVLNSPVLWSYMWRCLPHGKDDALRLFSPDIMSLPIASVGLTENQVAEEFVDKLVELVKENQETFSSVMSWLQMEAGLEKPSKKLLAFDTMSVKEFKEEVSKCAKKGTSRSRQKYDEISDIYNETTPGIWQNNSQIRQLEHRLSDLVNQAYQLTPDEIALLWKTAPPRMPIDPPDLLTSP
jgi:hypothetical protein